MRILVTGARGKVGAATIHRLLRSDHQITAVDIAPPVYERARGSRGQPRGVRSRRSTRHAAVG
jgi:UDP-glucose 4-epimerase